MSGGNTPAVTRTPALVKTAFYVLAGLMVLSFLGFALVALFGSGVDDAAKVPVAEARFIDACDNVLTAGVGALLGLLGGRAAE